jgi:hypothetical protein
MQRLVTLMRHGDGVPVSADQLEDVSLDELTMAEHRKQIKDFLAARDIAWQPLDKSEAEEV